MASASRWAFCIRTRGFRSAILLRTRRAGTFTWMDLVALKYEVPLRVSGWRRLDGHAALAQLRAKQVGIALRFAKLSQKYHAHRILNFNCCIDSLMFDDFQPSLVASSPRFFRPAAVPM